MAETTTITLDNTYQKVHDSGTDFFLQNVGTSNVYLVLNDSTPSDNDQGFILQPGDILPSSLFQDGDLYAKSLHSGRINLNE